MSLLDQTLHHVDRQIESYIEELKALVQIPSISSDGTDEARPALLEAANFLVTEFRRLSLEAQTVQMSQDTNPLVVAHTPLDPSRPTVLVYGHYDVQGVDNPRSAWTCDPFGAQVQNGHLLGRGASDNKGPTFAHIKAIEALQSQGELPTNVVFLIEGEEECGSRALAQFLREDRLKPFGPILCTLVSDTSMFGPERPSLTLGLRGIYYTEIEVKGPRQDVHSGLFGGIIHNPNHLLIRALDRLFDAEGRIAVPGFYDAVQPLSPQEKAQYDALQVDEGEYCEALGVEGLVGEGDYSILERRWTRPTLDINFLNGGSPRTVIPARARAALSARLVPDQDPEVIGKSIRQHIADQLPGGAQVEFSNQHSSPAYYLNPDHTLVGPTLRAINRGFGIEPIFTREGGSIPIVVDLEERTQAPVLLIGLGQITDNWHGPDERFCLSDFHRGIRTAAALQLELGALPPR